MWQRGEEGLKRTDGFFRVALSHDSLVNMYYVNFSLIQHHGYSLTELENMMPFEREIYVSMLKDYIDKVNREMENK